MIIEDVSYILGQFFDFYTPILGVCLFVYAVVIAFRRLTSI